MRVLLVIVTIGRCRAVTCGFVATGVAASMLERPTLPHGDRQRTVHRHGQGDREEQQESSECLHGGRYYRRSGVGPKTWFAVQGF